MSYRRKESERDEISRIERAATRKVYNQILKELRAEITNNKSLAEKAISDDLYLVYRSKAAEAEALYAYVLNLNNKYVKEIHKKESNNE